MGARLSQVELTLRRERRGRRGARVLGGRAVPGGRPPPDAAPRDSAPAAGEEHAPVKDELYRQSEAAREEVRAYSVRVDELRERLDSQERLSRDGSLSTVDYGAREPPDATGCVACAVAINKAYYGVAMGS